MNRSFNKIFCIGLNKTGTSSLHQAFLNIGLNSIHFAPEGLSSMSDLVMANSQINKSIELAQAESRSLLSDELEEYDAFSDIGAIIKFFRQLDQQYPNSKFVLTTREEDAWLDSRRRHVLRNRLNKEKGCYKGAFLEIEPEKWRETRNKHFERFTKYFLNRPNDLLVINICGGEGYEKLCPFLGLPVINGPFPLENRIK